MDASTLFQVSEFGHPNRYEEQPVKSPDSAVLMDMIFQYFNEKPPKSSPHPTPVESRFPRVSTWAASLPVFEVSPAVSELPKFTDDSSEHSIPSPLESMFSDSSSFNGSGGPKTPPLTTNINGTAPRPTTRDNELMLPEIPKLPPPAPPVNINRNCSLRRSCEVVRSPSRAVSASRRGSFRFPSGQSSPEAPAPKMPSASQRAQATMTNLVSLPEFVPSPKIPVGKKSTFPPQLRISTQSYIPALQPPLVHPEWELSFPQTRPNHAGRVVERSANLAPKSVRQSAPVLENTKELLRNLEERKFSPSRQYVAMPAIPTMPSPINHRLESINRIQASRRSMQIQIPSRGPNQLEMDRGQKQLEIEKVATRIKRQLEIEQAPTRALKKLAIEKVPVMPIVVAIPARSTVNQGSWFTKGFFAGREGMQIKMTRRVTTFAKMEWVIESGNRSKLLKCFSHTNSLSRKTDFLDVDETQICTFQKKTGSTRMAEAPNGTVLFAVKNASLNSSPHWIVNLGSDTTTSQWTAKGDDKMESVVVTWGGFQVGRISLESRARKHTYILSVTPEMNYCIMAALTTIFDDLRTDEGC